MLKDEGICVRCEAVFEKKRGSGTKICPECTKDTYQESLIKEARYEQDRKFHRKWITKPWVKRRRRK